MRSNHANRDTIGGLAFHCQQFLMMLFNAIREVILSGRSSLTNCDILKSIFFYKNHAIENEDDLIEYLLKNGVTHKEINDSLAIPLRRIQGISKNLDRKEL